jgi:ribosomal protein S18 acetylase RimI-like enzyme
MTQDRPVIRIFRSEQVDKAQALAIVDAYCEEIGVIVRDTPADFDSYFGPESGLWLAERTSSDGTNIVGCVILRPLPYLTDVRAAEVKRLYVVPDSRGLQVAQKLLDVLHTFAKDKNYERMYLDTKDDLTAAIKFYERQGYETCDRYNDNPQATIFMSRAV